MTFEQHNHLSVTCCCFDSFDSTPINEAFACSLPTTMIYYPVVYKNHSSCVAFSGGELGHMSVKLGAVGPSSAGVVVYVTIHFPSDSIPRIIPVLMFLFCVVQN